MARFPVVANAMRLTLPLPPRAIEGGSAGLRDPPYAARLGDLAIAAGAGPCFAVVDGEAVLEISQFAVMVNKIAERRAARVDGFGEHAADRGHQPFRPRALNRERQ